LPGTNKYGVREANVQSGRFGGANPGITKLWANIVNYLQTVKGVKTVFAINHMSEPWINGVPALIKYVVQGNKVFRQLCICAFILVPPDIQRGGQLRCRVRRWQRKCWPSAGGTGSST
jgi:hypothetical protein